MRRRKSQLVSRSTEPSTAALQAIRNGEIDSLRSVLREHGDVATARIDGARTLLHVVTDWPGQLPDGARMVALLVECGADVNAAFIGPHAETPLHWAASCDDVAVLDALLDAGADIEAPGAVIGGGTPLADAVAFGRWRAARRLVERGAQTTLWQAAALGLTARIEAHLSGRTLPSWSPQPTSAGAVPPDEITHAFWHACHGGQQQAATLLLHEGADRQWSGYDGLTPVEAARRAGAASLVQWLQDQDTSSESAGRDGGR